MAALSSMITLSGPDTTSNLMNSAHHGIVIHMALPALLALEDTLICKVGPLLANGTNQTDSAHLLPIRIEDIRIPKPLVI